MAGLNSTSCCGMGDITNLTSNADQLANLKELAPRIINARRPFCTFSCPIRSSHGLDFKAIVLEHKLGKVIESSVKMNPNSNNDLQIFLWEVDLDKLTKWWDKNKPFKFQVGDRVRIIGTARISNSHLLGMEGCIISQGDQTWSVGFREEAQISGRIGRVAKLMGEYLEYIPVK